MSVRPPVIEPRTADDFYRELATEMGSYGDLPGVNQALLRINADFAEMIGDRLNQVPDKLFLAFLDLLGVRPKPPQPAEVPLTFHMAKGAHHTVVHAGTQVESTPSEAETEPAVFETETDLVVTGAVLDAVFRSDPVRDEYADLTVLASRPFTTELPVFSSSASSPSVPVMHALLVGLELPERLSRAGSLRLLIQVAKPPVVARTVTWELMGKAGWERVHPRSDTTASLTRSGDVIFTGVELPEPQNLNGLVRCWLRARFGSGPQHDRGALIERVSSEIEATSADAALQQAVVEAANVDITREFYAFGREPRFGSTLYLRNDEAFGLPAADVRLGIELVNPTRAGEDSPVPAVTPVAVSLQWEAWSGTEWVAVGTSHSGVRDSAELGDGFTDGTAALSESGVVRLRIPATTGPVTIVGETGNWLRVRVASGDYGLGSQSSPPLIRAIRVSHRLEMSSLTPDLLSDHDFELTAVPRGQPFEAIEHRLETAGAHPSIYFGFDMPDVPPGQAALAGLELALYLESGARASLSSDLAGEVTWESWDAASRTWVVLPVYDGTAGFVRAGIVRSVAAFRFAPIRLFGRVRVWVRARQIREAPLFAPALCAALFNTVMARNVRTTVNEVIGGGNGLPGQTFRAARAPVLEGQRLVVFETELPMASERARVRAEEGESAIRSHEPGEKPGYWIRWHEVPDFSGSGPRDRHYAFDHMTGVIRFGDGTHGLPAPGGVSNVCLERYRTGGGAGGNKPPGTIVNVKTASAYVSSVANLKASSGGTNMEPVERVIERAPRELRHGDRAVTAEDYEDLARIASRQVFRAKCVPGFDLSADPEARRRIPGVISLIVMPESAAERPAPTVELLEQVHRYIRERQPPTAKLLVLRPEYVRIDIRAEVVVASHSSRSRVEAEAVAALRAFLHPCSGARGQGWNFGRSPKHSDVYAVLESISGIEFVRSLQIARIPDRTGLETTGRFVIFCGEPVVTAMVRA